MVSTKKHLDISDEDNKNEFKINKDFSEKYERYRSKEVLQKLKDKYGDQIWQSDVESDENLDDDDDNESDEDDESDENSEIDQEELFDEKFLRVYGALKSKDEKIYDQNSVFYTKEDVVDLEKKKELRKKKKQNTKEQFNSKMNLTDYHQKLIKEEKGQTAEDAMLANEQEEPKTNLTYYQELSKLKQDLLRAAGDEEDQDNLIVGKKVVEFSNDESTVNKNDAKTILVTKSKDDEYIGKLDKYWKSDQLDENEQFLRDFIINKTYLPNRDNSFNEHLNEKKNYSDKEHDEDEYDSDDSTHRKLVKTYETSKFHHQEPDANKIKSFPRQVESIRDIILKKKKSDKRIKLKERKKQQKEAELRKLRELKRNEIREKIDLIEKTTGTKLATKLKETDIDMLVDDTDFDAEKYDQKMKELFNDDYYNYDEQEKKPQFEYDSEIDDFKFSNDSDQSLINEDDYEGEILNFSNNNHAIHDTRELDEKNCDEKRLSNKKKKALKKLKNLEKKKSDKLKNKNFGIYEDVIDGQGIRFKYRKTQGTNYGLTDEEILLADDKELNKWVSLRKSQQYCDDEYDVEKYNRKGKNMRLKRKILKSIYASSDDEVHEVKSQNSDEKNELHKEFNLKRDQIEIIIPNKKRKKNRRKKVKKQKIFKHGK